MNNLPCARCSVCNKPIISVIREAAENIARIICGMCGVSRTSNDNETERSEVA